MDAEYIQYVYKDLLKEYYKEVENAAHNNTFYAFKTEYEMPSLLGMVKRILTFDVNVRSCTFEDINGFGLRAVYCIYSFYMNEGQANNILLKKLWRIIKIWLFIYLAAAIPLWCTKGWCCCCLVCKLFKPHKTIRDAKRYLEENPPGLLHTDRGQMIYEPTQAEIDRFEEFEHFIQTV